MRDHMKRRGLGAIALLSILVMSGCGTIFRGANRRVGIVVNPSDADVSLYRWSGGRLVGPVASPKEQIAETSGVFSRGDIPSETRTLVPQPPARGVRCRTQRPSTVSPGSVQRRTQRLGAARIDLGGCAHTRKS